MWLIRNFVRYLSGKQSARLNNKQESFENEESVNLTKLDHKTRKEYKWCKKITKER